MYASSKDSLTRFPDNRASSFTIHLPRTLSLRGKWSVGLFDIDLKLKKDKGSVGDLYVCCDLVVNSYVQGVSLKALRRLYNPKNTTSVAFNPVQYVPLDNSHARDLINFTILDGVSLTETLILRGLLNCTLHFKRESPLAIL